MKSVWRSGPVEAYTIDRGLTLGGVDHPIVTYQAGDLKRSRMKVGGGSYLSSHDPRLMLGVGQRTKIDWVEIKWPQPSGLVQRIADLPIDQYLTIHEGTER